jgi:streptogrisin C
MRHRYLLAVTVVAGLLVGSTPTGAVAGPAAELRWSPEAGVAMERDTPEMFAALRRDLGLSREQALKRLGQQVTAGDLEARLEKRLGTRYAGAWMTDDGATLVVAVTDAAAGAVVRSAGTRPKLVRHRLADLHAAADRLRATPLPERGVQGWNVDPATNRVAVTATRGQVAVARAFVAAAGVSGALVRYEQRDESMRPKVDVRGGIGFDGRAGGCSIGFNAFSVFIPSSVGFVTAGHCNPVGGLALERGVEGGFGTTVASTWGQRGGVPDQAYVEYFPGVAPTPLVTTYRGSNVVVVGSTEAPVGTPVCASGAATKWRCGKILRKNRMEVLRFFEPPFLVDRLIVGMVEASYTGDCGDSGGPVLARAQAQGVHVAGNGQDCGQIGTMSLYQPINPILAQLGLQLVELFNPPPPPLPLLIPILFCEQRPLDPNDIFVPATVDCRATWQGGSGAVTPIWTTNGIPTFDEPSYDNPATRQTFFTFTCQATGVATVTLSVVDAAGGIETRTTDLYCALPIPPW